MPSKKQRAKAAKGKATKKTGNDESASIAALNRRDAHQLNKSMLDVAENFSSSFVLGKRYDGQSCRHGATDPISPRCQRMVDGVVEIFKQGIVDPELDSNSRGSIPVTSVIGRFTGRPELSLVSAGAFGYQEEDCNIAYLSALGVELALHGHADMAYLTLGPFILSMGKWEGGKVHQAALDIAHSTGKQTQEGIAFFAKMGSCDCLQKQFNLKAIKKEAKIAECSNCKQPGSKKKLLICVRCKSEQYCSKDCQVNHWREHKPQCDRLKKFVKAAARDANVDTFATEQVMHTFGDDGKVATSYHQAGSIAPDGGCYFVTKDGEKVEIDESTGVIWSTLFSHPKGQGIVETLQGNPKAAEAMTEYIADPSGTLTKYGNDSDIGEMVRDFGEVVKVSGVQL